MQFEFVRRTALIGLCLAAAYGTPFASLIAEAQTVSPATSVVLQLQSDIQSISGSDELTPATDPDQLLGAPGQYIAKTNFYDSQAGVIGPGGYAGTVEVFPDAKSLNARLAFLKVSGSAASEDEKARGTVLLRVYATDQAAHYDQVFPSVVLP